MTNDRCELNIPSMPHRTIQSAPINPEPSHDGQLLSTKAVSNDDQILREVVSALCHSGYAQLRTISSYCHHGRVILQGRITTRFLKQVAQDVVRNVPNVKDVDNDLHVVCGY